MLRLCLPFARCLVLLVVLAASGCGLNRQLARQAGAIVAHETPHALDCHAADRCALDSPYQRLRAAADAESSPEHPVHYVQVLERGEDALLLRVHLIRAARRSIDIQTFIWADDDAGWLVLDELIKAARRGVKVRVLADQLFTLDNADLLARLARAHVNFEFKLYHPTFHDAVTHPFAFAAGILCCFSTFNQRMHNKLFLVDGEIGIAGGRNYENRYFDWDQEFDYRDRDALVIGPAAGREMLASFEEFWRHRRAVPLTRLNDVNRHIVADAGSDATLVPPAGIDWPRLDRLRARAGDPAWIDANLANRAQRVGQVDYFSDAPDKPIDPTVLSDRELTSHISRLIASARSQVLMQTPYLVISRRAQKVFRELHEKFPGVHVIVSTNSLAATDAFYVYALSRKYQKRYIKRLGFRIHEFKPFPGDAENLITDYDKLAGGANTGRYNRYGQAPLKRRGVRVGMHAKSMVIDDSVTLIGSHNFDPRSDHYNTESGFIIHDRAVAAQVGAAILEDTAPQNSWVIAKRPRSGLLARINSAITDFSTALPLFDFWPFRYATSYELDPGCQPLPPTDPRFYDCYTAVGDFPEVDLPLKTIYTRIVTAFGAGLVSIM